MTEFNAFSAGSTEAQIKKGLAYLFAQSAVGRAATGILAGLGVSQTTTASVSVVVGAGSAVVQASTSSGVAWPTSDADKTLDVLTASPMGALPRNDLVVFNTDTATIQVVIGTANASPVDPTVSANHIKLARIRNAANATTIPNSAIDDLRTYTSLFGAKAQGKRSTWGTYTTSNTDGSGYVTVTHGAGFTPSAVIVSAAVTTFASTHADAVLTADSFTATTFRLRAVKSETGAVIAGQSMVISAFLGE